MRPNSLVDLGKEIIPHSNRMAVGNPERNTRRNGKRNRIEESQEERRPETRKRSQETIGVEEGRGKEDRNEKRGDGWKREELMIEKSPEAMKW